MINKLRIAAAAVVISCAFAVQGATAQTVDFPALHSVENVAQDDWLNVRAAPNAQADIIGEFGASETDIEVTGLDDSGEWGRVNAGETAGWAAMRFLSRQDGQVFPEPKRCFGTEPFWSLTFDSEGATFTKLGETGRKLSQLTRVGSTTGPNKMGYVLSSGAYAAMGVVTRETCGDGMSDQVYGFSLDLIELGGRNNRRLYSGCCSLR